MIIYASLINDIYSYNGKWLYNILKDGVFEKRNLDDLNVKRYILNKNNIDLIEIYTNDIKNSSVEIRDIQNLGYKTNFVHYVSFLDKIYESDVSFEKQSKSIEYYFRATGRKIDICYNSCFLSKQVDLEDHIKQLKYIKLFLGKYINKIYIDFNLSPYMKRRKQYTGTEFTEIEKNILLKEAKDIFKKNIMIKKSIKELNDNEIDLGETNFCFSNNTVIEGFDNFDERRLKQKIHDPKSKSLILGYRGKEVVKTIKL